MSKKKILESLKPELARKKIITCDPHLLKLLDRIKSAASQKLTMLIQGETGTAKALFPQAIHYCSPRGNKPFIPLNCGDSSTDMFDSTVFGHIRGAFTSAISDKPGLVEEAENGTLFLDEINSLPFSSQIKLNRFLETGEFRRLGENRLRKANVRIIAASNRPLYHEVNQKRFREDLYYRINGYMINLPPLRKRKHDIPILMDHFMKIYAQKYIKPKLKFSDDVYKMAICYHWPGNIRELENVVSRSVIDVKGNIIKLKDFIIQEKPQMAPFHDDYFSLPLQEAKTKVIDEFEVTYLMHQLRQHNGNVEKCARFCRKHRSALWALIKKHSLNPQTYRI